MPHHLIRKLEGFAPLSDASKQALHRLDRTMHLLSFGTDIIREGDEPEHINLILSGWACRYKQLVDGRRQILSFFVPGDVCDTHAFLLREMDHSIGTLTDVRLAQVPRDAFLDLLDRYPQIAQAFSWDASVQLAVQRETTASLGQRSGEERMAHLLCELFYRLRAVGLTDGNTCPLPLSQVELASALGQSTVHINRTLQALRAAGLIVLKGKSLTIPDLGALQAVALFNPGYLHLSRGIIWSDTPTTSSHLAQSRQRSTDPIR